MHACLMLGRPLSHSSSRYISLNCISWVITDLIPWGRLGPAHAPPGVRSMCSIEGQRGSTCVAWVLDTTKSTSCPTTIHPPCWSSAANHNSSNYFLHSYGAMFQAGWIRPQYLALNRGSVISGKSLQVIMRIPHDLWQWYKQSCDPQPTAAWFPPNIVVAWSTCLTPRDQS